MLLRYRCLKKAKGIQMEKVEILLATYNGEMYLREQLDSILQQDYSNWIVRACDDASCDKTYEILLEYKNAYPTKFIVEKNEKGTGSAKKNFLRLIKNSTCQYVMCCDQDDVWLPNKISLTLEKMKEIEEEEPVLVHTDLKVVDQELNVLSDSFFEYSKLGKSFDYKTVLVQNSVTGCTMMMNRQLVLLLQKGCEIDELLMHDWFAAILAIGIGKVGFVDTPTMLYRQHLVNSVGAKRYGLSLFMSKLRKSDIRSSIVATTLQAGAIARTYRNELEEEVYQLMYRYSMIFTKRKVGRVYFYVKNRVLKKEMFRKIAQIVFG